MKVHRCRLVGEQPGSSPDLAQSVPEALSWEISHLEPLTRVETDALLDLIRSWCQSKVWTYSRGCRLPLLVEFAERHGFSGVMGAMAYRGLADFEDQGERLERRYMTNLLYHEKCMAICLRLQKLARQMGTAFTVIKGPGLTLNGYGDPGVRSYSDIDILTDSRASAMRLIRAVDARCDEKERQEDPWVRLNHPGRVHAFVGDWEVEFCYPMNRSGDPMFELMRLHRDRLLTIPESDQVLAVPDPSLHMVILIQHMARHLCNRFIWFFDLVVFERANRDDLDWTWIQHALSMLQMTHMGHWVSRLCHDQISQEFPLIECSETGWNTPFHAAVTAPEQICGKISLFHNRGWRKPFRFILSPARFFLITDPETHRLASNSCAAHWICARLMHAFGHEPAWLDRLLRLCCAPVMLFLSRAAARILMTAKSVNS